MSYDQPRGKGDFDSYGIDGTGSFAGDAIMVQRQPGGRPVVLVRLPEPRHFALLDDRDDTAAPF
jgi:hypothetical protein